MELDWMILDGICEPGWDWMGLDWMMGLANLDDAGWGWTP